MADIFIDCEWIPCDKVTILGAYSPGRDRTQLYGDMLTRNRFSRFLNQCCSRTGSADTLLFCHGPDIKRIEDEFEVNLKENYCCVNTIKAFKEFSGAYYTRLDHLEKRFGLHRTHRLTCNDVWRLWQSRSLEARKKVLEYNWEDCRNLWRLVNILKDKYGVTRSDFKRISMQP